MNCLVCHDEREAVLVDPGTYGAEERNAVLEYIRKERLFLRHLLLTHAHIDHILDLAFFSAEFELEYALNAGDLPLVKEALTQASAFGVALNALPMPGRFLEEGDRIAFGEAAWEVLHTPGHSPGSVSFVDRVNEFVIAGDVLFRGSVGRTDLWQGSMEVLLSSIHEKLFSLPDQFRVYPGHGPMTSIGEERATNPFLV